MKKRMNILVTGGNGQLGLCLKDTVKCFDGENNYIFLSKEELDISKKDNIEYVFEKYKPEIVINCAAYTNVERAQKEETLKAAEINSWGVKFLTEFCEKYNTYLIHISTDYVFNGKSNIPYKEEMPKNIPLNQYGSTKLYGDQFALEYKKSIVIRTSWLYSEYGYNFYKTMLDRIRTQMETKVVNDQIGTPTYAKDLAKFIVFYLIMSKKYTEINGLYNFSDNGVASWYDFASMIENYYHNFGPYEPIRKDDTWLVKFPFHVYDKFYIEPITTKEYKTKAKRPQYSVLDKSKVEGEFNIKIPHWTESLLECMKNDGIILKK